MVNNKCLSIHFVGTRFHHTTQILNILYCHHHVNYKSKKEWLTWTHLLKWLVIFNPNKYLWWHQLEVDKLLNINVLRLLNSCHICCKIRVMVVKFISRFISLSLLTYSNKISLNGDKFSIHHKSYSLIKNKVSYFLIIFFKL